MQLFVFICAAAMITGYTAGGALGPAPLAQHLDRRVVEPLVHALPYGARRLKVAVADPYDIEGLDVLVNNAGYGVSGHYLAQPWATHAEFLQVLVNAPCELAHLFLPPMQERRHGRILNVASLAGLVPARA